MTVPIEWDVICLGAGLTSLAFAAQLVQRNPDVRVLVLEKHYVPGGYASVFRRPRQSATFDCSLHKLSGMSGEGNLKRILSDMGLADELEMVYPANFLQASFSSGRVTLPNDVGQVKTLLKERYPSDAQGIDQFFQEVELHGKNAYFQFQMMSGEYAVDVPKLIAELRYALKNLRGITVQDAFKIRFKSDELRELLALPVGYVGGYPEDFSYLYFLHIIYATLYCGNAYVKGASQALSDVLVAKIERNGSKVLLRTRVDRVMVDDDLQFNGVLTNKGMFNSRQLYINAAPHYALEKLFSPRLPLADVKRKLVDLKPSWAAVTLYVVVDGDPTEYGLECTETFLIDSLNDEAGSLRRSAMANADDAQMERAFWHEPPIEITNYHALHPEGGAVLIFNMFDSIGHWPERRTLAYKNKKQRFTDVVLERFFKRFPGFRGHIKYTEVSTPRTYERYTNNTNGAGFGALVTTSLSPHLFHHAFPIANVHFMSTWLAGPSYEAAFGFAEHKALNWRKSTSASCRKQVPVENQA